MLTLKDSFDRSKRLATGNSGSRKELSLVSTSAFILSGLYVVSKLHNKDTFHRTAFVYASQVIRPLVFKFEAQVVYGLIGGKEKLKDIGNKCIVNPFVFEVVHEEGTIASCISSDSHLLYFLEKTMVFN
ncbi:hypothetical protein BD560DRAFT_487266 [Blakeslea trispora]|nr:hypothetical protein BD560DRAFT_487266 [Blakeslea trispora]